MGWEEFKTGAIRYFAVLGIIVAIILLVAAYSLRGKVASKFYEYRAGRQVVGIWEGERESRTLEHIPQIRARWEFDESTFSLTTDYFYAESNEWRRVHEMRGDYRYIKRGGLQPSQLALSNVTVRRSGKETSVRRSDRPAADPAPRSDRRSRRCVGIAAHRLPDPDRAVLQGQRRADDRHQPDRRRQLRQGRVISAASKPAVPARRARMIGSQRARPAATRARRRR